MLELIIRFRHLIYTDHYVMQLIVSVCIDLTPQQFKHLYHYRH